MDDITHLSDPSHLDPNATDHLNRHGPKTGIHLSLSQAQIIFSRIIPNSTISSFLVSSKGYNNRLYYVTIITPFYPRADEYIIKVCGRYWHRVKTETEVVGIWLANQCAHLPTPLICEWDSDGKEFGVEYTVMPRLPAVSLDAVWEGLDVDARRDVVRQLAGMVIKFKLQVTRAVKAGKIVNWIAKGEQVPEKPRILVGFEVGPTLDGDGPWTSYKAYLGTILEKQLARGRKEPVLNSMSSVWPRVEKLVENLGSDETIPNEPSFVFTHGDLNVQNILLEPSSTGSNTWKISALLDWEWSGIFPAEEEYFASYDFIHQNENITQLFYDLLEGGDIATPRTILDFEKRKALYDLRENIAPWYLLDVDDPESEVVQQKAGEAKTLVEHCLDIVGY